MNKNKILIIVGVLVFILILNFIGFLSFLNKPLNTLVAGTPDKSCNDNSDCVIRDTTCEICDCGEAVNKKWESFCPFKRKFVFPI